VALLSNKNFNVYFSQNGLNLGKFTAQLAEKLRNRGFVEYGLQRNIVVYNSFDNCNSPISVLELIGKIQAALPSS
jgi:hypothetical protein